MNDKTSLRREAKGRREKFGPLLPGHAAAVAGFADRIPLAAKAVIGGYVALPGEADPSLLLTALRARGATLVLPRVVSSDQPLSFHRWESGDILTAGQFRVPEPSSAAAAEIPDILLVPLLAYDGQGFRLGYGGGFYDRTLALLKPRGVVAIGVAYANQEIPSVPHEAHDIRLDMILTESGLRRFLP